MTSSLVAGSCHDEGKRNHERPRRSHTDDHHRKRESPMTNDGYNPKTDYHYNARQLVLEAAERSSLLKEVATLLWFAAKHGRGTGGACAPCELLERLTDAFDDLVCTPAIVGESVFSPGLEGLNTDPLPHEEREVDAFLGS